MNRTENTGKPPKTHLTKIEREERIDFAASLLRDVPYRSQQHKLFTQKYGLSWQTCDSYLRIARDRAIAIMQQKHAQHLGEAYDIYHKIAHNALMPLRDRIKAQARLDKILGLEAPVKLQVQDEREEQAQKVVKVADTAELLAMRERLAQLAKRAELVPSKN